MDRSTAAAKRASDILRRVCNNTYASNRGRLLWERPMPETPKDSQELTQWQKAVQFVIKMDREALEFLKDK